MMMMDDDDDDIFHDFFFLYFDILNPIIQNEVKVICW